MRAAGGSNPDREPGRDLLGLPDSRTGESAITHLEFVYVGHRVVVEEPGTITVIREGSDFARR